jgi:hypothetical protein
LGFFILFEIQEPKETVNEIAFILATGYLKYLKTQQNKAFTSDKAL